MKKIFMCLFLLSSLSCNIWGMGPAEVPPVDNTTLQQQQEDQVRLEEEQGFLEDRRLLEEDFMKMREQVEEQRSKGGK